MTYKEQSIFQKNTSQQIENSLLTVSELSTCIKNILESNFTWINLTGEISNLAKPYSGHIYFTLKDQNAQIKAVMWKSSAFKSTLELHNGLQVNVLAKISVFAPRGEYQLVVEKITAAGVGDLLQAFEDLKKELAQAGLFDQALKQAIPPNPKAIAIITSATGAALQDVLTILERRRPDILVFVYPCLVQGELAHLSLIKAIAAANNDQLQNNIELILLVRGGGSIEDLSAFNQRDLAYALAQSHLPIITGVGHETDTTIVDFVSDLRAATPSAAAELACLSSDTLFNQLDYLASQITQHLQSILDKYQHKLQNFEGLLKSQHPKNILNAQQQKLLYLVQQLNNNMAKNILEKRSFLALAAQSLDLTSPLKTLARGYAIIESNTHEICTSIAQLKLGQDINIKLKDGNFKAKISSLDKQLK
ncbi:exonuclease VII large subunit [Gammaproteobacteria bacterium]|nr:exonuclease VII large subunit [Gammaproteobacteria bacterium]